MTIQQLLIQAKQQLARVVPTAEASLEAQLLLMHVLNVDRAWLIAHANETITPAQQAAFTDYCARRLHGEPIAYIVGSREFFGLPLSVTQATLIPRPDTETLVEAALNRLQAKHRVLDLGTGSGAIALAIAKHAPTAAVTAVDASLAALNVAKQNAKNLGLPQVVFVHSDWFSALSGQVFDLIVSNPPYIEADDPHLQQGDLRFEPLTALAAGSDGLADLRTIIAQAGAHLQPGGWLLLEHGYQQAMAVRSLLQAAGFVGVQSLTDLAENDRVSLGQWPRTQSV